LLLKPPTLLQWPPIRSSYLTHTTPNSVTTLIPTDSCEIELIEVQQQQPASPTDRGCPCTIASAVTRLARAGARLF